MTYFYSATSFGCGDFFVAALWDALAGVSFLGILEEEATFDSAP